MWEILNSRRASIFQLSYSSALRTSRTSSGSPPSTLASSSAISISSRSDMRAFSDKQRDLRAACVGHVSGDTAVFETIGELASGNPHRVHRHGARDNLDAEVMSNLHQLLQARSEEHTSELQS